MTLSISLDDAGLDRVLGGGLRFVDRGTGRPSAVVLVRGPAGAGKTLLAARIAAAVARARGGDVAWGCVELMPVELAAQLDVMGAVLGVTTLDVSTGREPRPTGRTERVRILAGLLALGGPGAGPTDLVRVFDELLSDVAARGAKPGVLVIDSLADGYGLGARVARADADGVCKFAHDRGLCVVLLEESELKSQSPWTYAVDVVLEVDRRPARREAGVVFARQLIVAKNRFGQAVVGPHQFQLDAEGARVFPRPGSYAPLARAREQKHGEGPAIGVNFVPAPFPSIGSAVSAVVGPDMRAVRPFAQHLVAALATPGRTRDVLVHFDLNQVAMEASRSADEIIRSAPSAGETPTVTVGAGNPFRTPHEILAHGIDVIERALRDRLTIRAFLVGDLAAIGNFNAAPEVHRALAVLCAFARSHEIPVVAFEVAVVHEVVGMGSGGIAFRAPGSRYSAVVTTADLVFELRYVPNDDSSFDLVAFDQHSGRRWRANEYWAPEKRR